MKKLVSGIVIVLAVGGCGSSGGSGSISFSPATESCSNPAAMTQTVLLPPSVKAGDTVTETLDGKTVTSGLVSASGATQKADGSWTQINQTNVADLQSLCAAGGSSGGVDVLTPGTHTEQILDSSGKVLAQGSYTVTR